MEREGTGRAARSSDPPVCPTLTEFIARYVLKEIYQDTGGHQCRAQGKRRRAG